MQKHLFLRVINSKQRLRNDSVYELEPKHWIVFFKFGLQNLANKAVESYYPNQASALHYFLETIDKEATALELKQVVLNELGPVYSPNRPMLVFDNAGDQNKFIDLKNFFLEVKCEIV